MAQVGRVSPQADPAINEIRKLDDIRDFLKGLDILQASFPRLASPGEKNAAEGRRCVIVITGLKHHPNYAIYFEVKNSSLSQVAPFTQYTTKIEAPLESVLRVLGRLSNGEENVFTDEKRLGVAVVEGVHSLHDLYWINNAANRVARIIRAYKALAPKAE
jgi:hypothetical protein